MFFRLVLTGLIAWALAAAAARADQSAQQQSFLFIYSGKVTQLKPGEIARIWLPVPPSDAAQTVEIAARQLPAKPEFNVTGKFHNRILYLQAAAGGDGVISFSLTYHITRREARSSPAQANLDAAPYLAPDALVPVGGKPAQVLLTGRTVPTDPLAAGRYLYDLVDDTMQYRKDSPGWGRGDADWACISKFGNCTDFHSLFISLARTERLPAKFEIGFAIPPQRGSGEIAGYHCWAKFLAGDRGWVPVDIAQANQNPSKRDYYFGHLDDNRVMFSTGRDLVLVPKQNGPPLNFFVYPYVEVNGKPFASVQRSFQYQDVDAADYFKPHSGPDDLEAK